MKKLVLLILICLLGAMLCACGEARADHTHSYRDTVVAPSCTEGYTIHACTVCGYSYTDSYTPANGHAFVHTVGDGACNVLCQDKYTCSVCGYSYVDGAKKYGTQHLFYVSKKVSATLTSEGYTLYACAKCGLTKEDDFIPPAEFSVGLSYAKQESGYYVTGIGTCTDQNLVIPSVNEHGQEVVGIASVAFAGRAELLSVTVGQNITSIEAYAFSGCTGLRSVTLGKNTVLQRGIFASCASLEEVTLPLTLPFEELFLYEAANTAPETLKTVHVVGRILEGVSFSSNDDIEKVTLSSEITSVPIECFKGCASLSEVVLHDRITQIGGFAFAGTAITEFTLPRAMTEITNDMLSSCASLEKVVLHDQLTSIGEDAFFGCTVLKEIELPASVERIGQYAFMACESLERFEVPPLVKELNDGVFWQCAALSEFTFHSELKRIGTKTFMQTGLTEVVLPESVQSVGEYAFASCENLTRLELNGNLRLIASNLASGCISLDRLSISPSVNVIGASAFRGCASLADMQLPSGLLLLGESAFEDCVSLLSVEIPSGIVKLDKRVFCNCLALERVELPQRLTIIGASAFQNCRALDEITFPSALHTIGDNAFSGTGLMTLELSDKIRSVGKSAFSGCLSLASVSIGGERAAYGTHVFAFCSNLQTAVLREGVITLPGAMFLQCVSLKTVTLPQSLQSIGTDAFAICSSLEEMTIPCNVALIESAFSQCASLKTLYFNAINAQSATFSGIVTVIFGETVERVPARMFYGNTKLKEVTFLGNTECIGASAFASCTALESIELPASLTEIKSMAFYKTALRELMLVGNSLILGEKAFAANDRLIEITFEADTVTVGKDAFQYCASLSAVDFGGGHVTLCGGAFYQCGALASVIGDGALRIFDASDLPTSLYTLRDGLLIYGKTLVGYDEASISTDVVIPDGISYIIDGAFQGCNLLRKVTFPDTLKEIGVRAFADCTRLQSVMLPEGVTYVGAYAFNGCVALTDVSLPNTLTHLAPGTFLGCSSLKTITLGTSLTSIADDFYQMQSGELNVLCITYRGTMAQWKLIEMGEQNVLHQCSVICSDGKIVGILIFETVAGTDQSLTVDTDWTMTLRGSGCFQYDFNNVYSDVYKRVKKLVIGEGITELKSNRLSYFTSLEEIVYPTTLVTLPAGQFVNSPWYRNAVDYENGLLIVGNRLLDVLQSVEGQLILPSGLISIGGRAFDNCSSITEIVISEGVTYIGDHAFYYCSSLRSVMLPESLERMGNYPFSGCHALTDLTVPKNVKEIKGLLSSCASLRYLWILGSPTIGDYAYAMYCPMLEYVMLGDGTTVLPAACIYQCTALKGIVIPESLISPEAGAIDTCPSGVKLFFKGTSNVSLVMRVLNGESGMNTEPLNAVACLYSQSTPEDMGLYWYWSEDGLPKIWNE